MNPLFDADLYRSALVRYTAASTAKKRGLDDASPLDKFFGIRNRLSHHGLEPLLQPLKRFVIHGKEHMKLHLALVVDL